MSIPLLLANMPAAAAAGGWSQWDIGCCCTTVEPDPCECTNVDNYTDDFADGAIEAGWGTPTGSGFTETGGTLGHTSTTVGATRSGSITRCLDLLELDGKKLVAEVDIEISPLQAMYAAMIVELFQMHVNGEGDYTCNNGVWVRTGFTGAVGAPAINYSWLAEEDGTGSLSGGGSSLTSDPSQTFRIEIEFVDTATNECLVTISANATTLYSGTLFPYPGGSEVLSQSKLTFVYELFTITNPTSAKYDNATFELVPA